MHGNVQHHMVALPCATDAKLSWSYAKMLITMIAVRLGTSLNDTIKLYDPENPRFGTRICHLSPI